MRPTISQSDFQRLINRDIEWLSNAPDSAEKQHIEFILQLYVALAYGPPEAKADCHYCNPPAPAYQPETK